MPTSSPDQRISASGRTRTQWLDHLSRIGSDHGFFEPVAPGHMALFVEEGDTLLVSFDTADRMFHRDPTGLPQGFIAVQRRSWSLLSIISSRDSWFRDPDLIAFFDKLKADGVFASFSKVIFLGLGPACGYAACAFSAAAPGATVMAASPAATMDPMRAGFDPRFRRARRHSFDGPYGYAPDMVKTAAEVALLYDPHHAVTASHAAQFNSAPVAHLPLRWTGPVLDRMLDEGRLILPLLRAIDKGHLDRPLVTLLMRAVRRKSPLYLWRLAQVAQAAGQFDRARVIADYAAQVTEDARFVTLAQRLSPEPAD